MWYCCTLAVTGCACNVSMMSFGGEIKCFGYTSTHTITCIWQQQPQTFWGFLVWKCRALQHKCYLRHSAANIRCAWDWAWAYACAFAATIQPEWCSVIRFYHCTHFKFPGSNGRKSSKQNVNKLFIKQSDWAFCFEFRVSQFLLFLNIRSRSEQKKNTSQNHPRCQSISICNR